MTIATTLTHLCIDKVASGAGWNPVAFAGANMGGLAYVGCSSECLTTWYQHAWQAGGRLSREELAGAISSAESTIENFLGVPLCPERRSVTVSLKNCGAPNNARRGYGLGGYSRPYVNTGCHGSVRDGHLLRIPDCPFWLWGAKKVEALGMASYAEGTLKVFDQDGNDFFQSANGLTKYPARAVIEFPLLDYAPGQIQACEVKVAFVEQWRDERFHICPRRPVEIFTADADTADAYDVIRIHVDPWQIIRPELWLEPTGASCPDDGICLLDHGPLVRELMLLWEYHDDCDPEHPPVEFIWHGGNRRCRCQGQGCDLCKTRSEPGCVIRDCGHKGLVKVHRARFNPETCEWCDIGPCDCSPAPDCVKVNYWTGFYDGPCEEDLKPCDVPCPPLEGMISCLALARLPKPLCGCTCGGDSSTEWRTQDTMVATSGKGWNMSIEMMNNPIGNTRGEINVWKQLELIKKRLCKKPLTARV